MSYRLREKERLGDSVRRISREQITGALKASAGKSGGHSTPVHETRKHIKKARAVVRLVADEMGKACFKKENQSLRDVGRLVSQIRDAEVRLDTVQKLRRLSKAKKSAFTSIEHLLVLEAGSFEAAFSDWHRDARPKLTRLRARIRAWPLGKLDCKRLRQAVHKTYLRGHGALQRAIEDKRADNLHTLRKRVKDLWYQMRILRPLQPTLMNELADELKTIGEHLGSANDLAVLAARARQIAKNRDTRRETKELCSLIDVRRKEMEGTAVELARHFYAESPKQFSKRIAIHFDQWETGKSRDGAGKVMRGKKP